VGLWDVPNARSDVVETLPNRIDRLLEVLVVFAIQLDGSVEIDGRHVESCPA
jgi:hypothetical protein